MTPRVKDSKKTYQLLLDVRSEGVDGKRAVVKVLSARKKGKRGGFLAPRNKKKCKCFGSKEKRRLVDEICANLEGRIFLQKDIVFKREANSLFATKSAFGTPSRRFVISAAKKEEILRPESSHNLEKTDHTENGEDDLELFRRNEYYFRKLDHFLREFETNPDHGVKRLLASAYENIPLTPRDLNKVKDIVLTLRHFFRERMRRVTSREAAELAGNICKAVGAKTVYMWKKRFLENGEKLWVPTKGKYSRQCILEKDGVRQKCLDFLVANADERGKPNMTAHQFKEFLKERIVLPMEGNSEGREFLRHCQLGSNLSYRKALGILKQLEFKYTNVRKTGYCDGRYREDVQKYKKKYCKLMKNLARHMPLWAHLRREDFKTRFRDKLPEHWEVEGNVIEFSIDALSEIEFQALDHRFGGNWSRRKMPEISEVGVAEGERILLFSQDEVVFKTNDDRAHGWRKDGLNNHRRKKSEGQGLMVSAFCSESLGFMQFTDAEMHELEDIHQEEFTLTRSLPRLMQLDEIAGTSIATHQYGKNFDGYWNNSKIMQHTKEFLRCARYRLQKDNVNILILYDWSSGHAAMADDGLVASKMKWKLGGQQPRMHDAIIRDYYPNANDPRLRHVGSRQSMVFKKGEKPFYNSRDQRDFTGIPKGIMQVLWERGLYRENMCLKGRKDNDGKLREETSGEKVMSSQADFQWEPCALSKYVREQGAFCIFTPKFHPELNFIERAWGRAKWFHRLFCDYTFPGLKSRIGIALGIVPMSGEQRSCHARLDEEEYVLSRGLIRKHARASRDYVKAYNESETVNLRPEALKKLKSHRAAPAREYH